MSAGYLSRTYASSLAEFGSPCLLDQSKGWVLDRDIPGTVCRDLMGVYPFFCCQSWDVLNKDIEELKKHYTALSLVTDPLGNWNLKLLESVFQDCCYPFKKHFVINLNQFMFENVPSNHKRNAKKALRSLDIHCCEDPSKYSEIWCGLYKNLIQRHNIQGIAKFSSLSFDFQFNTPGLLAYRADKGGRTVGMVLWYVNNEGVVYYHLGAYSKEGYELGASFAIFQRCIEDFLSQGLHFVCLGAGAGLSSRADDGLTRFKRGWSNMSRTVYLCGRILNRENYNMLAEQTENDNVSYFPLYRAGEF